jgi:actin-related protein 5
MTGFDERLRKEMQEIFPFGANIVLKRAQDSLLDPWRGARKWIQSDEAKNSFVTRKLYNEVGHDYLLEHSLSNPFFRLGLTDYEE